jgi:Leucine-rich repeat (LRR) protein
MATICEYGGPVWYAVHGNYEYECSVFSTTITERNTTVTASSFPGEHDDGKTQADVDLVHMSDTIVHFLPRGLNEAFPHMKVLDIEDCGLKEICREDLRGLQNLEHFYMSHNELKTLPDDLLVGMNKLKRISFDFNKLEKFTSEVLKPILKNKLTYVGFSCNTNIHACFGDDGFDDNDRQVETLKELMDKIDATWKKDVVILNNAKFAVNISNGFQELWTSGRYSDFTVTAGNPSQSGKDFKKFRVHKSVLATQSSVFAAAFDVDMKERQTSEMNITDFKTATVEEFLRYCYTGQVQYEENAMELIAIASKYNVSQLMSIAEEIIVKNIDETNVFEVFCLGKLYSLEEMQELAFDKIKACFPKKELNDDLKNDPGSLNKLLEASRTRKRKIEQAEEEFESSWKRCKKNS